LAQEADGPVGTSDELPGVEVGRVHSRQRSCQRQADRDHDQARAHLGAALAVHEQMGAALLAARTRFEIDQLRVGAR
jgi:hypothetical protein